MRRMRMAIVLVALAGIGIAAPAANAQAVAATGYLEICKKSDSSAPVRGSFNFRVDANDGWVSTTVGGCTAPIQVTAGNHTVTEQSNDWTVETATRTIPQDRLVSSNRNTRVDVVSVPAGDVSDVTTVEFTNAEQFGTLEVCKAAQAGSGFSGSANFSVTGPMGFSRTLSVPVGACSASFSVPAGDQVEVDEVGPNSIGLVAVSTVRSGDLLASDLLNARTRVRVAAGGVANETIETFVDGTSRLKICKVAGDSSLNGTVYSFTANGDTVSAVAQPAPGGCVLVDRAFAGGTRVDIQEGIVPGTANTAIDVSNNRAVPGSTDLTNRKVSVILGRGETVVTYTNKVAQPGLLKVCKNAGSGVALGRVFRFMVNGSSLDVPAGYCAVAGSFPFNSTAIVSENAVAGLSVIAEAVDPLSELISKDLPGRIVRTLIGAGVTEVSFTNATAGTTSTDSIGSSSSATTDAPTTIPSSHRSLRGARASLVIEKTRARHGCRLVIQVRGHRLVLRVKGHARRCAVVIRQFSQHGNLLQRNRKQARVGRTYRVHMARHVARVRASLL